jgi:uncharacterized RDD family membrane protein YckC
MNGKIFCNQCGREATPGTTFCVQCGARMSGGSPTAVATGAAAAPAMAPNGAYPGAAVYPSQSAPLRYGGFWIRFVAAFIDGLIVSVVVMPVSMVIAGAMGAASAIGRTGPGMGLSVAAGFVNFVLIQGGNWLYEALMESSSKQATLGKMIFGMKVTDLSGNRISFARASGRYFSKWISLMTLLIGYVMAGFTAKKQALHDMIAGTLVRR